VWCSPAVGEPVFAVHRTPAGRWSIVAPCCRDLSGRIGVRRIAVLDEPAAGGAKVIKVVSRIFRTFGWLSGTRPWLTR